MNIILLSGGSGKRLWPLSNDVRSKQFIKLLRNEEGQYESMVQRVYRQIMAVDDTSKVTIATNKAQASAIKNQLGDAVSICVEPCRRDTFPAILLSVSYLHDVLGVGKDEGVVVCPVDPYVDNSYYETVQYMGRLVEERKSNLFLMGIQPEGPSEKYGYIIPSDDSKISAVKEFKEKPDVETAKRYLTQNALWNGGVFAFRLGYLLDIAHSMVEFKDYYDLYEKYETLTKISFDYAVVEKESNIRVVRYSGSWKDVGTWSTMSEVMPDATKGKVLADNTCERTHVINELEIPIICMGCKDMVIIAGEDGILVSDRERSDAMKTYVEKLDNEEAMFAEKSWGTYRVIDAQKETKTVHLSIAEGRSMSYHSYEARDITWTILSGSGKVIIDGNEKAAKQGDVFSIQSGSKHMITAYEDLEIIEVQFCKRRDADKKRKYETVNIVINT